MTRTVAFAVVLIGAVAACRDATTGIRTEFVGSYAFSATERRTIARIAGLTAREARQHLPALPQQLTLRVQSGTAVIPELGATATVMPPDWVVWIVDPDHPHGVVKIAEAHLRAALFHEFHHLVRAGVIGSHTLIDHVVTEGLASAFERDFAGASYPWTDYPGDVAMWVEELLKQPPSAARAEWFGQHPDGRRRIGYKAGTYLVDQAMKRLNRSSAELVTTPTNEILGKPSG